LLQFVDKRHAAPGFPVPRASLTESIRALPLAGIKPALNHPVIIRI
jgi:hypothetical protein